jgi:hypothetical protein
LFFLATFKLPLKMTFLLSVNSDQKLSERLVRYTHYLVFKDRELPLKAKPDYS